MSIGTPSRSGFHWYSSIFTRLSRVNLTPSDFNALYCCSKNPGPHRLPSLNTTRCHGKCQLFLLFDAYPTNRAIRGRPIYTCNLTKCCHLSGWDSCNNIINLFIKRFHCLYAPAPAKRNPTVPQIIKLFKNCCIIRLL